MYDLTEIPVYEEKASEVVEDLVVEIVKTECPAGLYAGLAGAAWILNEYVEAELGLLSSVDDRLVEVIGSGELDHFEFVHGVAGVLNYFNSRGCKRGIAVSVESLCKASEADGEHRFWRSESRNLPNWQRPLAPEGWIDLGLRMDSPESSLSLGGL